MRAGRLGAGVFAIVWMVAGAHAGTLDDVRARGELRCGVSQNTPGFSQQGPDGRWVGLDVDTCRAVAAAVLGDDEKAAFSPLASKERFTTLESGDIDLLVQVTTWTLQRDAAYKLSFAGINFYDGQGFMTRRDLGLRSARELDGARICVTSGTTTELNLVDYFKANDLDMRPVHFEHSADAAAAYEAGKCDAVTNDRSALAGYRTNLSNPDAHVILPEVISKEPLGPVVREGDDQWADIVRWTLFALLQAEESGVTSENVDAMKTSSDPTVQRLVGVSGDLGRQLGLTDDWSYQVIRQVGNYGEIYDRNVGPDTPLGLERGRNAQWTEGGLMFAMPFR